LTGLSGYGSESDASDDDDRDRKTAQKDDDSDDHQVVDEERRNSIKLKESQINVLSNPKPDDGKSNVLLI